MSTLTPASGDLSVKLLNTILGHGWSHLLHGALGAHLTLLGQLFGVFNAVVMSGLVALFATVTTSGVISTAHSGSVLGKKMNSAWVPIRAIGSIGLLSPLPFAKGLCLIHKTMHSGAERYTAMHYISMGYNASECTAVNKNALALSQDCRTNVVAGNHHMRADASRSDKNQENGLHYCIGERIRWQTSISISMPWQHGWGCRDENWKTCWPWGRCPGPFGLVARAGGARRWLTSG